MNTALCLLVSPPVPHASSLHHSLFTPTPHATHPTHQGGDVVNDDGTGAFSAWGGKNMLFRDENLSAFRHTRGVISMVNQGPDTNGCQFFVTLAVSVARLLSLDCPFSRFQTL